MQISSSFLHASLEWFLTQAAWLSRQSRQLSSGAADATSTAHAIPNTVAIKSKAFIRRPGSALCSGRLVERGTQARGELDRVVVRPEMHEDEPRLLVEHVAVDRRHLDAIGAQLLDHRIDLLASEHEVAGDRRLAAAGRLEIDRGRY